jgi:mannose-6-phosphate isomerase
VTLDSPNIEGLDRWSFEPRRVEKPWGWELIWAVADDYVGKVLFVKAGESLSLQFHREKDESWYVQSGRAQLELGDAGQAVLNSEVIATGACFRYRPGTVHRITALEDRYGRKGTTQP